MEGWTINQGNVTEIVETEESVQVALGDQDGEVYYLAPSSYLGKRIWSYGGRLAYKISSAPATDEEKMSTAPDIILKGHNLTLEYWSLEQPVDPKEQFLISAELTPVSTSSDD